jgi:peptide/nickel transport system permease protein
LVVLIVALIAFCLFQFVGDPVHNMLGQDATPQQQAELRQRLGLDQPTIVQFARFIANFAQGDLGLSYRMGRPVSQLIAERLPATIELSLVSGLFASYSAYRMGVAAAVAPDGLRPPLARLSLTRRAAFTSASSCPLFAVTLGWLPSFARRGRSASGRRPAGAVGLKPLIAQPTLRLFQLHDHAPGALQILEVRSDFISSHTMRP